MITVNKQLLTGTPGDIRAKVEDLARDQDDREYLAGTWFRELAVKLATRDGLAVSAVTRGDPGKRTSARRDRDRPQPAR
jgi:hypothetical protein